MEFSTYTSINVWGIFFICSSLQVLGAVGKLPDIYVELEISYFLLRRLLGVRTEGDKRGARVIWCVCACVRVCMCVCACVRVKWTSSFSNIHDNLWLIEKPFCVMFNYFWSVSETRFHGIESTKLFAVWFELLVKLIILFPQGVLWTTIVGS